MWEMGIISYGADCHVVKTERETGIISVLLLSAVKKPAFIASRRYPQNTEA